MKQRTNNTGNAAAVDDDDVRIEAIYMYHHCALHRRTDAVNIGLNAIYNSTTLEQRMLYSQSRGTSYLLIIMIMMKHHDHDEQ